MYPCLSVRICVCSASYIDVAICKLTSCLASISRIILYLTKICSRHKTSWVAAAVEKEKKERGDVGTPRIRTEKVRARATAKEEEKGMERGGRGGVEHLLMLVAKEVGLLGVVTRTKQCVTVVVTTMIKQYGKIKKRTLSLPKVPIGAIAILAAAVVRETRLIAMPRTGSSTQSIWKRVWHNP